MKLEILCFLLSLAGITGTHNVKYEPNWESLDSRPLPAWYDEAKIGIFMHFGPYAVPGIVSEWFWKYWTDGNSEIKEFMHKNFPASFTYQDFGPMLKMEFFDADKFAEIVKAAGAKYLVFTSKHHDGFANFETDYSFGWNSVDVGPKRDVIGELKTAFGKIKGFHFGLYHSLFEWYNPLYLSDKASGFKKRDYVEKKVIPQLKELVEKYEPEVLWSDGDWEANPDYWNSTDILAWLFNESPKKDSIVVNDRWGRGTAQQHGSFYSGPDRYNPGKLQKHKFEDAMTVDSKSWGHRRNMAASEVLSVPQLLKTMIEVVACGGNFLMNVGPSSDGTISPIFEERLRTFGDWLSINGGAIYNTKPWAHQNETIPEGGVPIWYTSKGKKVYGIFLSWPKGHKMTLKKTKIVSGVTKVYMPCLGSSPLNYTLNSSGNMEIIMPCGHKASMNCQPKGRNDLPFVIAFDSIKPSPVVRIMA